MSTHSFHGTLWLSLAHSGSLWLAVRLSPALSGSLPDFLWVPLALSDSLRLSLTLSGSLLISKFDYQALTRLTMPLLSSERRS